MAFSIVFEMNDGFATGLKNLTIHALFLNQRKNDGGLIFNMLEKQQTRNKDSQYIK